jgi:amino acid transporter
MSVTAALTRKAVGTWGMGTIGASASAPMVVLAGGIVATYSTTRVIGVPLGFVLIGVVVALLSVGVTAMVRRVPHTAMYYAILSRGLGRGAGVAGGLLTLLAYSALETSLFGLVGATVSGAVGGPWWVWAGAGIAVVGVFGVRDIVVSVRLLAVVLAASLLIVGLFVLAALAHPAGGSLTFEGFAPGNLAVTGVGGACALCVAAMSGYDTSGSYAEEARNGASPSRAMIATAGFLTAVYAVAAWAMGVAVGPQHVAAVAADPGGGLPFAILAARYGTVISGLGQVVLVLAILASAMALHSTISRYTFAMAREGVLPTRLAETVRPGSPVAGSVLQTVTAAGIVTVFAWCGADPITSLFTWLSTLGALSLLVLLISASVGAVVFFARSTDGYGESIWTRAVAPLLGVALGGLVLAGMVGNVDSLLGAATGSPMPMIIPGIGLLVIGGGLLWAGHLRRHRPVVFDGIGHGLPIPHAVPDRFDNLDV